MRFGPASSRCFTRSNALVLAVCCNGYGVFQYLFRRPPERPGLQPGLTFGPSLVFASPSTSGLANARHSDRLVAFQEMGEWMMREKERERNAAKEKSNS
jgi:hypothetical protein